MLHYAFTADNTAGMHGSFVILISVDLSYLSKLC